jgi:hypothetical protein
MIVFLYEVPEETKRIMEQVVGRRKSTFPFTYEISTYIEKHDSYTIERMIEHSIIRITIDPGILKEEYKQFLLDTLPSRI